MFNDFTTIFALVGEDIFHLLASSFNTSHTLLTVLDGG